MNKPYSNPLVDELTAACNSLGKIDENDGTYMKDRDCKPCLREITRFLTRDTDNYIVRTTIGSLNLIKSDLIPLMNQYCDYENGDSELFASTLRLCTNLTSSPLLFFENQDPPTNPESIKLYNKLSDCLIGYKEAFATDENIWSTLKDHLRNFDNDIIFEQLIILIRNILQITHYNEAINNHESHDQCLIQMEKSGLLDMIIQIASETQKGTEFCFHLTEIIYYMLRDQNPVWLAEAKEQNRLTDSDRNLLAQLVARERRQRDAEPVRPLSSCFKSTSYLVSNLRSISGAPLIVRNPPKTATISFDAGKTELRKARNKKPISAESSILNGDNNAKISKISYNLRNFCHKFVEKVFCNFMQHIKHNLMQKKATEDDEIYYLWSLQFFIPFTKHLGTNLDAMTETLSTSTIRFVQILMLNYQEKLSVEKKKYHSVSRKLHLSIRAYKEILYFLKSNGAGNVDISVFTEPEYSAIIMNLFKHFDEAKHPSNFPTDLVKLNHVLLQLLEEHAQNTTTAQEQEEENTQGASKKRKGKKKRDHNSINYMIKYCCPEVIAVYLRVLRNFKQNSDSTNLQVLEFFEKVVHDCKHEVLLHQASVFKCLLEITDDSSSLPHYSRFLALAKYLMETFATMATKRRWMFQELLFWKTNDDLLQIENSINPPPVDVLNIQETETEQLTGEQSPREDEVPREDELPSEFRLSSDDEDEHEPGPQLQPHAEPELEQAPESEPSDDGLLGEDLPEPEEEDSLSFLSDID